MWSGGKHLEADGILDLCLRLMRIRADKSAVGAINRPLQDIAYPYNLSVLHIR
jgi:hypothetical protein